MFFVYDSLSFTWPLYQSHLWVLEMLFWLHSCKKTRIRGLPQGFLSSTESSVLDSLRLCFCCIVLRALMSWINELLGSHLFRMLREKWVISFLSPNPVVVVIIKHHILFTSNILSELVRLTKRSKSLDCRIFTEDGRETVPKLFWNNAQRRTRLFFWGGLKSSQTRLIGVQFFDRFSHLHSDATFTIEILHVMWRLMLKAWCAMWRRCRHGSRPLTSPIF
jgi:hypothetical protein